MLRGGSRVVCDFSFLRSFLAGRGVAVEFSAAHLLPRARGRGRQELCFQQVVRRARPFSSSGPSRHFPHNDDDDPTHEADG